MRCIKGDPVPQTTFPRLYLKCPCSGRVCSEMDNRSALLIQGKYCSEGNSILQEIMTGEILFTSKYCSREQDPL